MGDDGALDQMDDLQCGRQKQQKVRGCAERKTEEK